MTSLGRSILVWVARHLLALVLIVLILIAGRYAFAPAASWLKAQIATSRDVPTQQDALSQAARRFEDYARVRRSQLDGATGALAQAPEAALRRRRAEIDPAIADNREARLSGGQIALAAASGNADRIFGHYRAGVEIALLEREARYIDALLAAGATQARQQELEARRREQARRLEASYEVWKAARDRANGLNRRPFSGPRNFVCRNTRSRVGCENYRALAEAEAQRDAALAVNRSAEAAIRNIDRARNAMAAAKAAAEEASALFEEQEAALARRMQALERRAERNWLIWIRQPIVETLPTALLILALAIFGPMLIKAFLYFVIAPIAARRPPVRLVPSDTGVVFEGASSAVSQRVPLEPDQELLVLPEAVQSTSHDAAKATKWLLSWSMPLSSLAAGMVALIRVRSRRPDFVLVSATRDPLAEIGVVTIADGSAMVLRPRALRGIVEPAGRPVLITRHWRLANLSAWLTFQFRYIVFHGPCTLIVQGRRGIRLEAAGSGRGVNQAATVGFSAGLAYSVRRCEAFGAYLIGKQELFNDSFEDRHGFYLYEEMPREGAGGGIWGRGLRGLGDAGLKVFGV